MLKVIGFSLTVLVIIITASSFTQTTNLAESIERGKGLYALYCQKCHSEDGTGQAGTYPPLANADYMKKPDKDLIAVILNGQSGEVTVNGIVYNDDMQPLNYLTDEQIADVLNYTKNTWGNKSTTAIKPEEVKQARQ
ncbi:MAG TPA: cytochrome c [Mucilaginibacter sp.]|jgi:nitrite reductase (NO-forming)